MVTYYGRRQHAIGAASVAELRSGLEGQLILPEDPSYDQARRVWNAAIDRYPALIVRCANAADVAHAVQFANAYDMLVAVRGGGHNVAGNAVCDGGMVIDLSAMKAIRVDAEGRRAVAEPGLTWGDFDRATGAFGLATPGGLVSTTGIAGLTLGGGIGWLMRRYGLTCDNLLAAQVVTAHGQPMRAAAEENADLFWGLRGGGGNFGIVTEFEYRLHRVRQVLAGMVFHRAERARALLRFYREFSREAPDEVTSMVVFLTGPAAPFLPPELHGEPLVAIGVCHTDAGAAGEAALSALRHFGPPLVDLIGPLPYTTWQTMQDASAPPGLHNYWKSGYLPALSDDLIEILVTGSAGRPSPLTAIHLHHLGGALSRVPAATTAVAWRTAPFAVNIVSAWPDAGASGANITWTRRLWAALEPLAQGVYVNFLGEEGPERVRAAYGNQYDRLSALKRQYDPTNFFRLNQNIGVG